MSFYEFSCSHCGVIFGLSIKADMDPENFFCVECGATDLQLTAYDEELSLRIATLVESVNELTMRVNSIEEELCDSGPVSSNRQDSKTPH